MKLWDAVVCRQNNEFPFSACIDSKFFSAKHDCATVLNLLKSRDTIAVLQGYIAFDAFPL